MTFEVMTKEMKPIVLYRKLPTSGRPIVGYSHDVIPVNHPRSHLNGIWTVTSCVVSVEENGTDFETIYSRYMLEK